MRLHHDKHHRSYIDNLNKALAAHPQFADLSIEELLQRLNEVPEEIRTVVRSNGGGHANHQLFWKIMKPGGGGTPEGALAKSIDEAFGSFEQFKSKFEDAGAKHFGSGWVFLILDPTSHKLDVLSMPNQDSVLLVKKPALLGNDVWEHAYYLKYQNRRPEYLKAWWNIVAWDVVADRLEKLRAGRANELGGPYPPKLP